MGYITHIIALVVGMLISDVAWAIKTGVAQTVVSQLKAKFLRNHTEYTQ